MFSISCIHNFIKPLKSWKFRITHTFFFKFQFDYDTSVCLVDKFPEATAPDQVNSVTNQISFAPGEGKIPENKRGIPANAAMCTMEI